MRPRSLSVGDVPPSMSYGSMGPVNSRVLSEEHIEQEHRVDVRPQGILSEIVQAALFEGGYNTDPPVIERRCVRICRKFLPIAFLAGIAFGLGFSFISKLLDDLVRDRYLPLPPWDW